MNSLARDFATQNVLGVDVLAEPTLYSSTDFTASALSEVTSSLASEIFEITSAKTDVDLMRSVFLEFN
jgi:hypothetical protein